MEQKMDELLCQDCGNLIRKLDPDEVQDIIANPYNWVVYCITCHRDHEADE